MGKKSSLPSSLSGVAGEYFVAAELTRRGYIASITLRNTKGVDILCSNMEATKTIGVQVKTNKGKNGGRSWLLNEKAEKYSASNLFYVFVNLNNNEKHPDYFIVPSKTVAVYIKRRHIEWLNTPGKKGQKHNDSSMRRFDDPEEKYFGRWDILGLS